MPRFFVVAIVFVATLEACRTDRVASAPSVRQVVIAPVQEPLLVMQPEALSATVISTTGEVLSQSLLIWGSSDSTVATVSSTGVVMPRKTGTVRITAISGTVGASVDLVIHMRWLDLRLGRSSTGACGIGADSAAYCWGTTVGLADGIPPLRPTLVSDNHKYRSIGFTGGSACAIASDGHVFCWGNNDFGQLGDGTKISSRVPVQVNGVSNAIQIAVGNNFACATTSLDLLFCWGADDFGQIGDGMGSTGLTLPTTQLTNVPPVAQLSLSGLHGCALAVNAELYCWGYSPYAGVPTTSYLVTPARAVPSLTLRDLTASMYLTCGTATVGGIYCWGLGAGGPNSPSLVPGTGGLNGVVVTSISKPHYCAIGPSGVYCWGWALALGYGSAVNDIATPTLLPGSESFVRLEASETTTCALTAKGVAYCWGDSALGDGTTRRSATPVVVADP